MNDTAKRIASAYLTLGTWFFVMAATALAAAGLTQGIALDGDAGPLLRASIAMAFGIVTATVVAGLLWTKLRASGSDTDVPRHPRSPIEETSDATLVTIR